MVRMKDERIPKRSETRKQEGSRKRGRPQLRWEDCVKRDLRKAEEKKSGEKGPTTGTNGIFFRKVAIQGVTTRPASPLQNGNQRKKKIAHTS